MSTAEATQRKDEVGAVVAAARAGDEAAFGDLVQRYLPELRVHCYRMLGSFEDAEDQVQETFLRAWRKRETFEGRSSFRAWLYRIATNACLDALQRRPRREVRLQPGEDAGPAPLEVHWLQPFPDRLLDEIPSTEAGPDAAVVAKETIELAFMVAIQHLPPRPRAVVILRDVLGWSAKDTAELLDTTTASVNSALQRARAGLKERLPERRLEWAADSDPTEQERVLLQRYIDACERADADALGELMREDGRFSMPPESGLYEGREAIVASWKEGGLGSDELKDFRCLLTRANRQPAVACYLRRPGDSKYRALALDVLHIEDGTIAEIIAFPAEVFGAFELPPTA
jgi:RNA polymerase sigma-70 factor, ECF subfamily